MKKFKLAIISIILGLLSNLTFSQTLENQLEDILTPLVSNEKWSGAILLEKDGKIQINKGFGFDDRKNKIPINSDSKFQLGKASVIFTSLAIMQLKEKGKLSLNDPISKFIPKYPHGDKITIHHLLALSSGIPDYISFLQQDEFDKIRNTPKNLDEMINIFINQSLEFEPGEISKQTRFKQKLSRSSDSGFSNSSYLLLTKIIETVSGISYEKYIDQNIFKKLDMKNSGFLTENKNEKLVNGYKLSNNDLKKVDNNILLSNFRGTQSAYSSVNDLFKLIKSFKTENLLKKESFDLMSSAQSGDEVGHRFCYGWAWSSNPDNTNRIIYQSANDDGLQVNLIYNLDSERVLILLGNIDNLPKNLKPGYRDLKPARTPPYLQMISRIFNSPKGVSAFYVLDKAIQSGGMTSLKHKFNSIKDSDNFFFLEPEINYLGYKYINLGQPDIAVEIFRINTEKFPKSGNAFDSYAEGLMNIKKDDLAVKDYKKSLELNPKNENATKMIEVIKEKKIKMKSDKNSDIYLKKSKQSFTPVRTNNIAFGDIDNDGDLDMVAANMGFNNSKIWFNDGNGQFEASEQNLTQLGHGVKLGDLDNDGDLDIFITCAGWQERGVETNKPSKIYFNDGKGFFIDSNQDLKDSLISGNSTQLFDIDKDGDLDARVTYNRNDDRIYINNGKGFFTNSDIKVPDNCEVADLNNDGLPDFFVRDDNKGYKVLLNKGKMKFEESWSIEDKTVTQTFVTFSDLDNDKDIDIIVTNGNRQKVFPTKIFLNDGKGNLTDTNQKLRAVVFGRTSAGDINGDGFKDLVISSVGQADEVWINDGNAIFSKTSIRFPNASSRRSSTIIDINGDKKQDLIIADFFGGSNQIWFNDK